MKYTIAPLAFSAGATALVARASQQCVQISASGGASGILGQLGDGQNRIGGGLPTGCYCLGSNGGFTDTKGRGCILTPPTTQFQCDAGAGPTTGFAIGSNGQIMYNGNAQFYACPVNDYGVWNVYSQPAPNQKKCVKINLSSAGSCGGSATQPAPQQSNTPAPKPKPEVYSVAPKPMTPAPAPPASSAPAPAPPASSAPAPAPPASSAPAPAPPASSAPAPAPKPAPSSAAPAPAPAASSGMCPADLNGNYQYPHLIVPIHSDQPDKAYGTSYFGDVSSTVCSIFNFDIPASYSGKTCSVVFLWPEQKDLQTSSYTTSGTGKVNVSMLSSPATQSTTWNTCPASSSSIGSFSVAPGNSYNLASGSCAVGQRVSYKVCGEGSFMLHYFQDYNPSPIGLYVRQC